MMRSHVSPYPVWREAPAGAKRTRQRGLTQQAARDNNRRPALLRGRRTPLAVENSVGELAANSG